MLDVDDVERAAIVAEGRGPAPSPARARPRPRRARARRPATRIRLDALLAATPPPLELARRLGLEVARGARAHRCRVRCPWHDDSHPSCTLVVKGGRVVANCHACDTGGDALELVAAVHGLLMPADFRRAAQALADVAGVELELEEVDDARTPVSDPQEARLDELGAVIDAMAERWLDGLDHLPQSSHPRAVREREQVEALVSGATTAELLEVFRRLARADRAERELDAIREASLERLADAYEART